MSQSMPSIAHGSGRRAPGATRRAQLACHVPAGLSADVDRQGSLHICVHGWVRVQPSPSMHGGMRARVSFRVHVSVATDLATATEQRQRADGPAVQPPFAEDLHGRHLSACWRRQPCRQIVSVNWQPGERIAWKEGVRPCRAAAPRSRGGASAARVRERARVRHQEAAPRIGEADGDPPPSARRLWPVVW